jgi:hypothetical protein
MSISRNSDGGEADLREGGPTSGSSTAAEEACETSGDSTERERVERAGFPYPIRRCPPREFGQR